MSQNKLNRLIVAAILVALFLSISVTPLPVNADSSGINHQRLALVIGNSNYKDYPLRNPVNDARDMARALKKNNFEVILKVDATQKDIIKSIDLFGKKLRNGGIGLFFYAGHGIQMGGNNYIIPIDAKITSESDVKWEGVAAGRILGKMEDADNDLNIIILDACRNNPYARSFRSAEQGLAKMDAPKGAIIAYSTSPGDVAADGQGRNAPYTKYLLQEIREPGQKIEEVLKNVRIAVMRETADRQVPWESSSLTGNFYFNDSEIGAVTITSPHELPSAKEETLSAPAPKTMNRSSQTSAAEWLAWQEKMNLNFLVAQRYDNLAELSTDEKIKVWQSFLEDYPVNNPTSNRDEELRDKGLTKLAYWRAQKAQALHDYQAAHNEPALSTSPLKEAQEIAVDGTFTSYDNNTVVDSTTNLMWATGDNGRDVTWQQAKDYCEQFTGGGFSDWRMPTRTELASLYDKAHSSQARKKGYTIHLTHLIQLDTCCPWASDTHGKMAGIFHFGYGAQSWRDKKTSYFSRILPVR